VDVAEATVEQAMEIAIVHHRAGRLAEAEGIYRQVLALLPEHASALHLLGTLALQTGHLDAAVDLLSRSVALGPDVAEPHCNLGEALRLSGQRARAIASLHRAIALRPALATAHGNLGKALHAEGRLAEAIAAHRRAIELDPASPVFHGELGVALYAAGRRDEAIAAYGRAVALGTSDATVHSNLGVALNEAGAIDEAIASHRRALALDPARAESQVNLGVALFAAGRLDEALAAYARAIALRPDYARAHANRGYVLKHAGRLDEAIPAYRRAIELDPANAEHHADIGVVLFDAGRRDEAIGAYHRAIQLRPDHAVAHSNLGVALYEAGRFDEAIATHRRAIAITPGRAESHNNLGVVLYVTGQLDEALTACTLAIELNPDYADAHTNLGNVLKDQGRLDEAIAAFRRALAARPGFATAESNLLLSLHNHPDYDAQAILAEHRQWAMRCALPLAGEIRPHPNDRTPDRRLRIGFVSPDFRSHPVGRLLLPLFEHRDRRQSEFVVYSDVRAPDEVTARLSATAEEWYETVGLSDAALAGRIRGDRVDILVDLALHTANNRMLVFARKPAPVQVTMLGLPTTTGLSTMNYRLTDPHLDPPGATDADYTEQSIRLPHCFWVFQPPEESPPVAPLPAAANGFVTFGCLNQLAKVTRPAIALWIEILQALPGSRLVLQPQSGSHLDAVRGRFEASAIGGERIEFATRLPRLEHLRLQQRLDIGLDPFPYNGHTSTLDAAWMGVPVVTLAGRTAVGRGGVSILTNLGLPELIARSPAEYVAIAVELARDLDRLTELRSGLRQRLLDSPLVDGKRYASDVDAALRRMWTAWCGS
jgi:predicted O-linked N-acetylglucosamine transferase (SPINDLY family)